MYVAGVSSLAARLANVPPLPGWIPHAPTPKQWAALACPDVPELLYGGAAGGGKSDYLLMAALQFVHVPGYAALLLRRTWGDLALPGALLDRAHAWMRNNPACPGRWNAGERRYEFPNGAILAFGHLDTENHKYRYQGAEFQFVGFDELTQFTESQYSYLASRLRRLEGSALPIRLRGATNPGGQGHEWVRDRFMVRGRAEGRVFVRSRLEDNPHVDRAEYEKSLAMLDHITRAQLRHGDWDALPDGGLFLREWFKVAPEPPPAHQLRHFVRFWDLAGTEEGAAPDPDYTAGTLVALEPATGRFWILDQVAVRKSPAGVEALIRATAELDGPAVEVDVEQEGGASGKMLSAHLARTVLSGHRFRGQRTVGDKVENARPMSVAAENGLLWLVRAPWNTPFINEAVAFPNTPHDDRVDSASKGLQRVQALVRQGASQRIGLRQVAAGPRVTV